MSKRNREAGKREDPAPQRSTSFPSGALHLATLAGVGVLLFLSVTTWNQTRKLQNSLDERMNQVQTSVTQLAAKVQAAPARAPQPAPGPDPNRVYTVKTSGAPTEGPPSAPVTIAEFSDFQ